MATTDERLIEKMDDLATSQAVMTSRQDHEARQNSKEHAVIIRHLEATNGAVAELRDDFDQATVLTAQERGHMQGAVDTIRFIMAATLALVTVIGVGASVTFGIVRLAGG